LLESGFFFSSWSPSSNKACYYANNAASIYYFSFPDVFPFDLFAEVSTAVVGN
jgi:hypothetical protein